MPNRTVLRMKAVVSTFYSGLMRKREDAPQEALRSPITVAEPLRRDRIHNAPRLRQKEPGDVMRYLSVEERAFLQRIKEAFQLTEDDLHLFHLVGYARLANAREMRRNPDLQPEDLPQPDFSPDCLSLLMECVQPTIASSRGYYAAMLHLKQHPVPSPWRAEED